MQRAVSFLFAAVLIAAVTSACAEPAAPRLLVDLKTVVAGGMVPPLEGLRTAGQPDAAALKVFAENGYKTVIDIRGAREKRGFDEKGTIESLGMNYVNMPIRGKRAINFANARKLDELLENADGPVLLHCGSGDRVGALLALRESLHGAEDAAAIRFGKAGGLRRLEPRVRKVLSEG